MEPWWQVPVNTFLAIGLGVPFLLSFIGVPVLMRLRIVAAMAVGAVLIGFFGWPLAKPIDPLAAITIFAGDITAFELVISFLLAFLTGVIAYFVSYPYGMQVGPIAGATGFSVWAFRSGNMSSLLRMNHTLTQRQALYEQLRWEGFLWLAIIAVSYLGVIVADRFFGPKAGNEQPQPGKRSFSANNTISIITA
ncbi:MAG: hypothetical protein ACYTFK_06740, partial [Planctomycetota bacterium]